MGSLMKSPIVWATQCTHPDASQSSKLYGQSQPLLGPIRLVVRGFDCHSYGCVSSDTVDVLNVASGPTTSNNQPQHHGKGSFPAPPPTPLLREASGQYLGCWRKQLLRVLVHAPFLVSAWRNIDGFHWFQFVWFPFYLPDIYVGSIGQLSSALRKNNGSNPQAISMNPASRIGSPRVNRSFILRVARPRKHTIHQQCVPVSRLICGNSNEVRGWYPPRRCWSLGQTRYERTSEHMILGSPAK